MRPWLSSANVENVVKPPHTPVLANSTARGGRPRVATAPTMSPIANEPSTLVTSVPSGNSTAPTVFHGTSVSR